MFILHFFFAHFSVALSAASDEDLHDPLTYEKINAIACLAGYVLRALKKKLLKVKSPCPLTKDMLLCLDSMISSDNEINDWFELVNCGGLTCVNSITSCNGIGTLHSPSNTRTLFSRQLLQLKAMKISVLFFLVNAECRMG